MRREQIEKEALRLFAEHGVQNVSMRQIAEAVGIQEGGLYRHITSKEDLAHRVFQKAYADFAADLTAAIAVKAGDPESRFRRRIREIVTLIYEAFDRDPVLLRFLVLTQHDHLARVPAGPGNPVDILASILREAAEAQVFRGRYRGSESEVALAVMMGVILQPLTSAVYGRLPQPVSPLSLTVTLAALRVLGLES